MSKSWRATMASAVWFLVAATVVLFPLAVGGVPAPAAFGAALLLSLALGAYSCVAWARSSRLALHGFGLLLCALSCAAVLQVVPLPSAWVQWLSPRAWEIHVAAATLAGDTLVGWMPLSLDPVATMGEAARLAALAMAFMLALNASIQSEQLAERVLLWGAISGVVVALVAVAQTLAGGSFLFGLYTPARIDPTGFLGTPFVNENHASGFFNLTGFVALGLSQHAEERRPRAFYTAAALLCFTCSVLCMSRAGLVSLGVGGAAFALLVSRVDTSTGRGKRLGALALAGGATLLVAAALAGHELLAGVFSILPGNYELAQDLKFQAMEAMAPVVRDYPLVGVGAGALADVFARYNEIAPSVSFTHAESLPLDLALQFGLPVGIVALGCGAYTLAGPVVRGMSRPDTLGAGVGLCALVLQNFVDFGLLASASGLVAALVVGALVGLDVGERREQAPRHLPRRRTQPAVALGMSLAGLALAVSSALSFGQDGRPTVDQALRGRAQDISSTEVTAEQVAHWARVRPADGHLALMEAVARHRRGEADAASAWLTAALDRSPTSFAPRLLEARILASASRLSEAASVWRSLFASHRRHREAIVAELAALEVPPAIVADAMPEDNEELLWAAYWFKTKGHLALAEAVLRGRLDREPGAVELRWELGLLLIAAEAPLQTIEEQATLLLGHHPARAEGYMLQGFAYERSEQPALALVMFEEASKRDPNSPHAMLGEARSLLTQGQLDAVRQVGARLRPRVARRPELQAQLYRLLSDVSEREGRFDDALLDMEMAVAVAPNQAALHARLGELRVLRQDVLGARAAFERALKLAPQMERARRGLEQLDAQAAVQRVW